MLLTGTVWLASSHAERINTPPVALPDCHGVWCPAGVGGSATAAQHLLLIRSAGRLALPDRR